MSYPKCYNIGKGYSARPNCPCCLPNIDMRNKAKVRRYIRRKAKQINFSEE